MERGSEKFFYDQIKKWFRLSNKIVRINGKIIKPKRAHRWHKDIDLFG